MTNKFKKNNNEYIILFYHYFKSNKGYQNGIEYL